MLATARSRFAVAVLHRALSFIFLAVTLSFTVAAVAQQKTAEPAGKSPGNQTMQNLDMAIDEVAEKVMPCIVQIDITGFGPSEEDSTDTSVLARQRALGSGVIVDPNGYIITNAHVVSGAQRIRVLFIPTNTTLQAHRTSLANRQRAYSAKLVGLNRFADLAVIKIDATDLPYLKLQDLMSYRVRLGQEVIAIGSPLGLDHTITHGIVSAVGRQPDANKAMIYVQTDAPINPGNSGGALVDRDGNLIGINTFIYTKGGGSEGLGFAIPEPIVRHVYDQIRQYGHVRQNFIGADVQTITADLAAGLGLSQDYGVIVSDVAAEGPADKGGLKTGDVLVSFDGIPTDSLPRFVSLLYLHPTDMPAPVEVKRGDQTKTLTIQPVEGESSQDLSDFVDQNSLVSELGVFVLDMTKPVLDNLSNIRSQSGVVVAARIDYEPQVDNDLQASDIIVSLNNHKIGSVSDLRAALAGKKVGDPVALQIERQGAYRYVSFEME